MLRFHDIYDPLELEISTDETFSIAVDTSGKSQILKELKCA
jgi:hypothetical protein